jgi:hypothetical protein
MLRDGNIEARDQFFKTIDQDIKKMSGMDLSLTQNQDAAASVFNQMLDNDNIVKDMVWTKTWQQENQRANAFRDCVDPDKCGGSWWEGGQQALNFRAEEFKNATDDQAMRMANARFTPYQDVMKKAMDLAKEAGLSISMDEIRNGYIVTTKNGPKLVQPLQSLFMGSLGKDPAIMDYYKTKAYVERKQWIQSNAAVYGSEDAAKGAYYNNMTEAMSKVFGKQMADMDYKSETNDAQRKVLEERIKNEGTTQNSSLAQQYRELNNVGNQYAQTKEVVKDAHGNALVAQNNGYSEAVFANLDNAVAAYGLSADIGNAAQTLAYKDFEFSMEADPYSLEGFKQKNRLALDDHRTYNNMLVEKYKFDLEQVAIENAARGSMFDNLPIISDDGTGNIDIDLDKRAASDLYEEWKQGVEDKVSLPEKSMMIEALGLTQQQSLQEGGKGTASTDLIAFTDAYVKQRLSPEEQGDWDSKTPAQKLKYAQEHDFTRGFAKMSGSQVDALYNNVLLPSMDMSNEYNSVNKPYLTNLWESSKATRNDIKKKNAILEDLGKWEKETALNTIQNLKESNPELGTIMEAYIDPQTGEARSKEEFAKLYADEIASTTPGSKTVTRKVYHGGGMDAKAARMAGAPDTYQETITVDKDAVWKEAYVTAYNMYDKDEGSNLDYALSWAAYLTGQPTAPLMPTGEAVKGLEQTWAEQWSDNVVAEGRLTELGLMGSGSFAAKTVNFPMVDPSKYKSEGAMQTNSFMQNAMMLDADNMRVQISGPSQTIPGSTSSKAQAIMTQVYQDLQNRKNPKDNERPILDVSYQDIAGGDKEWTAMNIKFNQAYIDQYTGTKKEPGLFREWGAGMVQHGMTVYVKKDAASNGFRKALSRSDDETAFYYTGNYNFDSYPEIAKNLNLIKNPNGGYLLQGNVGIGIDEEGSMVTNPIYNTYSSNVPINDIVNDWETILKELNYNYKGVQQQFNAGQIKDPAQILQ